MVVALCVTSPRWTLTPHEYSTTVHWMLTVDVSLVTRSKAIEVAEAILPRISLATGRLRFERTLNIRYDFVVSTDVIATVVVPLALLLVVPDCTSFTSALKQDAE